MRLCSTIYIIGILLCSGCGRVSLRVLDWDSRVSQYAYSFETANHRYARDVSIHFVAKLKDSIVGQCNMGNITVQLSEEYWNTAIEIERQALVWHELGHCIMGWMHNNEIVDNCQVSYMNSFIPSDYCLERIFK